MVKRHIQYVINAYVSCLDDKLRGIWKCEIMFVVLLLFVRSLSFVCFFVCFLFTLLRSYIGSHITDVRFRKGTKATKEQLYRESVLRYTELIHNCTNNKITWVNNIHVHAWTQHLFLYQIITQEGCHFFWSVCSFPQVAAGLRRLGKNHCLSRTHAVLNDSANLTQAMHITRTLACLKI